MKRLLTALALLSGLYVGAEPFPCPDFDGSGEVHILEVCPTVQTNLSPGDSVMATTMNVTVTNDLAVGLNYTTLFAGTCSVVGSKTSVEVSSPTGHAFSASNGVLVVGANVQPVTGVSPATEYCIAVTNVSDRGTRSRVKYADVTTAAGGSTPPGKYINVATGSVNNSGVDDANAWADFSNIGTMSVGENLYMRQGQSLPAGGKILLGSWGCTSGDPCEVNTYWMDNGVETPGTESNTDPGNPYAIDYSDAERFTILGEYPTGFLLTKRFDATFYLNDSSGNVHIKNINITDVNGRGIEVGNNSGGHHIFEYLKIDGTATNAIIFNRDTAGGNSIVRNVQYTRGGQCGNDNLCNDHPVILSIVNSDDNEIYDNYAHRNWGEGISPWNWSKRNHIHDNVIVWNMWTALRIDGASDNIIERNLVIGAARQVAAADYMRSGNSGTCMGMAFENGIYLLGSFHATGNIFKDNVCIGNAKFMNATASSDVRTNLDASIGVAFYGNTSIYDDVWFGTAIGPGNVAVAVIDDNGIDIMGNIYGATNPGSTEANCNDGGIFSSDQVRENYNTWGESVDDGDCDNGANDVALADSKFGNIDWTDGSPDNIFVLADFTPGATADTIDTGPTTRTNHTQDYSGNARPGGTNFDAGAIEKQ